MSNAKGFPTLVTYRSAEAFRDAGIRYAYMKAGLLASFVIAVLAASLVFWLARMSPEGLDSLAWILLAIAIAAGAVAAGIWRAVEFPQCPRMTLEELDAMRSDMGIPAHVFQQTSDSVLQGSMDEVQAGLRARELIEKMQAPGGALMDRRGRPLK